jgi:hypothetical protein
MTKQKRNINDVLKVHDIDVQATPAERLAKFLDHVAIELPKRFVNKRIAAKVAFAQKRMPGDDSDFVKRMLPSAMQSAKRILNSEKYNRDLYCDKVEGIRATVDDEDVVKTTHRAKRRRIVGAINSYEITDRLVDLHKLSGEIKVEAQKARKAQKVLRDFKENVPLLLPAKPDQA